MTDPMQAAVERSWGVDDWECPEHGPVSFSEPCESCGRREGEPLPGLDALDAAWDRLKDERLEADLPLWEGEAS